MGRLLRGGANEALSHATGDYAFWPDADDMVEPDEREKLRALLGSLARAEAPLGVRRPDAALSADECENKLRHTENAGAPGQARTGIHQQDAAITSSQSGARPPHSKEAGAPARPGLKFTSKMPLPPALKAAAANRPAR